MRPAGGKPIKAPPSRPPRRFSLGFSHDDLRPPALRLGLLSRDGLARPDPLGLGIDVDVQGRAIGRDGRASEKLFVAGPLARGTFGELMGVPDLARHARNIAESIARMDIRASRLPPPPVQA